VIDRNNQGICSAIKLACCHRNINLTTTMPSTLHPASNCRAPLAPKSNTGSVGVEARTLALPLTLYRPALDEVKMMSTLLDIYPDLAGIPAEYIRARLSLSTPLYGTTFFAQ
jgi:hypothetical protein